MAGLLMILSGENVIKMLLVIHIVLFFGVAQGLETGMTKPSVLDSGETVLVSANEGIIATLTDQNTIIPHVTRQLSSSILSIVRDIRRQPGYLPDRLTVYIDSIDSQRQTFSGRLKMEHTTQDGKEAGSLGEIVLKEVRFDQEGALLSFSFHDVQTDTVLKELQEFTIIQRDTLLRPVKAILLKHHFSERLTELDLYKFDEGVEIAYLSYHETGRAMSLSVEQFELDAKGRKRVTRKSVLQGRTFNEQGQLQSESMQESSFQYTDTGGLEPALYNVSFTSGGMVEKYIISFDMSDTSATHEMRQFKSIWNQTYEGQFVTEKLIRFFYSQSEHCVYTHGQSVATEIHNGDKKIYLREDGFSVTSGTSGEKPADRIPEYTHYTFEDRQLAPAVVFNRSLSVQYEKALVDGIPRDVSFLRTYRETQRWSLSLNDQEDKIRVCYFGIHDGGTWQKMREIHITVDERNAYALPSKITLTMDTPGSEEPPVIQTIENDCLYIIDESLFGDLFHKNTSEAYRAEVKSIEKDLSLKHIALLELEHKEQIPRYKIINPEVKMKLE